MEQIINDFINSIDTKLYSRIRASKGDAECRRYLKEHLQKQLSIPLVSQQRVLLLAYHRYLTEELSLDLHEIWVDEHLKANNCA
jgi:hypothetical protein